MERVGTLQISLLACNIPSTQGLRVIRCTLYTNVNNTAQAKFLSTRYFKIGLANIFWFANIRFPIVVDVIESTS